MTVLTYIFNFIAQLLILLILIILVRRLLTVLSKNNSSQKKYLFYYDVVIYLIWILFVILKIAHALNDNLLIVGSAVLILIALMWEYLKNLFLGIIFAFQYGYIAGNNLLANGIEGKLESYYSSYFEILTNKGERLKVKYEKVFSDKFEIYKGNLHRVFNKIEIKKLSDSQNFKLKIMNHPLFIMNNNFDFYQERDDNGKLWLCFYFNVMNFTDAVIIQEYIDKL